MGSHRIDRSRWDWRKSSAIRSGARMPRRRPSGRHSGRHPQGGSSTGAVIELVASGIPVGLGQPLYGKLDAEIAAPS